MHTRFTINRTHRFCSFIKVIHTDHLQPTAFNKSVGLLLIVTYTQTKTWSHCKLAKKYTLLLHILLIRKRYYVSLFRIKTQYSPLPIYSKYVGNKFLKHGQAVLENTILQLRAICYYSILLLCASVPWSRTTMGILRLLSFAAAMIPLAISSHRIMPPKMFTNMAFTCKTCYGTAASTASLATR